MAIASITQYHELARDAAGNVIQAGKEPAISRGIVTYTTSTSLAAFDRKTTLIRIIADADAYIRIGSGAQTAVNTDTRLGANVAEYLGVMPGQIVAIYDGTS